MKIRKIFSLLLAVVLCLAMSPFASADDIAIPKIILETYPSASAGYNEVPEVGQNVSDFIVRSSTGGVNVTGWTLYDSSGAVAAGTVKNEDYTLSVSVSSSVANEYFTSATQAYINNVASAVTVTDSKNATVTRRMTPRLVAPTVWHSPTDETHTAGDGQLFSFAATATPNYTGYQWYIQTASNEDIKAEDLEKKYPGVVATVKTVETGTRCNIHNATGNMDGWRVYCVFSGPGGDAYTKKAVMHVKSAAPATPEPAPSPSPTPEPTPSPSPTPEPSTAPAPVQWEEAWSYDAENHWHRSTDPNVTEVSDLEAHQMVWTLKTAASRKSAGEEQGVCSVCGYTASRAVEYVKSGSVFDSMSPTLKWVLGAVGGLILLLALIIFLQYLADRRRRKRRKKMSGGSSSRKY